MQKEEDLIPFLPTKLPRFKPGDRPAGIGDWELVELLGIGGFGEVWKARNPNMRHDPPVALKFCLDAQAVKWLRNEADLLNRVKSQGTHRGIVQLLHTYLRAEAPCLEFEYVAGGDLSGLIAQWRQEPPSDLVSECTRRMLELAEIVAFAHQRHPPIVHRDLKPANILLQPAGDGMVRVRVADFGIGGIAAQQTIEQATRVGTSGAMLATVLRGAYTPLYASPQQMQGNPPDPRDDVFALGVIWHQLLTGDLRMGRPGGRGWRNRLTEKGMSEQLLDLLESCFEDNPEDRPKDAKELFDLLSKLRHSIRISELQPVTVRGASVPSGAKACNRFGVRGAAGYVVGQLDETSRTEQQLIQLAQDRTPEGLRGTRYENDDTVECPALRKLADRGAISNDSRWQIIVERGSDRRSDRYSLEPVANPPNESLRPAKDMRFDRLSSDPQIVTQLEQLHELVLSVCPDCLIEQRRDGGWIYVPAERRHAEKDKNLLTMWAEKNWVRMRIMWPKPSPEEEYYEYGKLDEYKTRLRDLYDYLSGQHPVPMMPKGGIDIWGCRPGDLSGDMNAAAWVLLHAEPEATCTEQDVLMYLREHYLHNWASGKNDHRVHEHLQYLCGNFKKRVFNPAPVVELVPGVYKLAPETK
jgi:serine/threonine protein kinase